MNIILFCGALAGLFSVLFGAYAEHGLKEKLDEDNYHAIMVAINNNKTYALLLSGIGLTLYASVPDIVETRLYWCGLVLIAAVVLFCGSIYAAILLKMPGLMKLTPIGGIMMMAGWIMLAYTALVKFKQ